MLVLNGRVAAHRVRTSFEEVVPMRTNRTGPRTSFAMGVAVSVLAAVSLSAWRATAAPGDDDATFFPVAPCRLFDFRPAPLTVGPRTSPLGPGEVATQQVTGAVGDCTVPSTATAVAMNVTIVRPTAASYLTIFPADETTVPLASSLNWVANQAPTPNKVDVKLSPSGAIKLFNELGTVYVLADVVGYYSDASLDEVQANLAALESRIAALESAPTPYMDEVSATVGLSLPAVGAVEALALPTFVAPAQGMVLVTATAWMSSSPSGYDAYCAILPSSASPSGDTLWTYPGSMIHETDGLANDSSATGVRSFSASAGASLSFSLFCQAEPGASAASVFTRNMTMTYLPD